MENASKALLIAAGVIISLLIITLLVVFYNQISSYYAEKHNMTLAEQLEEFNSVYQNYQDKEIRGNELISIINRIIDYNNLQADMKDFKRIVINVDMLGHVNDLSYNNNTQLFEDKIHNKQNDNAIKEFTRIITFSDESYYKLSSEIHNIVLENPDEEEKIQRAKKLTKILGDQIEKDDNIDNIIENLLLFYEVTQFKRTMFKCYEVSFDSETGRVNGMKFEAVLDEDGKLKME